MDAVYVFIIIIYLFSKMEKYSWIKQENTEQGEPGSYERLITEAFTCIQFEQSYTGTMKT